MQQNYTPGLEKFVKNHYLFPSNNSDEIIEFIEKDVEMEKIIHDLPNIIYEEFQDSQILVDFVEYDYPEEKILKITVKTPFDIETSLKKEEIINNNIVDAYNHTENEFFVRVEP